MFVKLLAAIRSFHPLWRMRKIKAFRTLFDLLDFPIAVRASSRTAPELLRRIAQVQRHGGGIVAVYNEDLIIGALIGLYVIKEAFEILGDARRSRLDLDPSIQ